MDSVSMNDLDQDTQGVMLKAQDLALRYGFSEIMPLPVLIALLDNDAVQKLVQACGAISKDIQVELGAQISQRQPSSVAQSLDFSDVMKSVIALSIDEAARLPHAGQLIVTPRHLLLGFIRLDDEQIEKIMRNATLTLERARAQYKAQIFAENDLTQQ